MHRSVSPMCRALVRPLVRTLGAVALSGALAGVLIGADPGAAADATITLPPTCDIAQLTDLVARSTGVSFQFGVGKVSGSVRLAVAAPVNNADLWSIYHQALANQGFTTVITGLPAVYQVVPLADAHQSARVLTPEEVAQLPYLPGFQTVIRDLHSLSADTAMKALSAVFTTPFTQVRAMGPDGHKLLIAAPTQRISEADAILRIIDKIGQAPEVRLFRPERTTPQALQASATGAWSALGRVDEHPRAAEVMIAPDGLQLMLVATATDIVTLEKVVRDLDRSEPTEARTYRPKFFPLDDVASLIQQTLGAASKVDTVRDTLTGSLIIKATVAEHERITALVRSLDDAPAASRRQAQSLQVKHRRADEIARLIMAMISAENGSASRSAPGAATMPTAGTAQPAATPAPMAAGGQTGGFGQQQGGGFQNGQGGGGTGVGGVFGGGGIGGVGGTGAGGNLTLPPQTQTTTTPTIATSADGSLVITADPVTNRMLVLGEPRMIEQVTRLLAQLDIYQPQVDLELILVTLSDKQSLSLGVELAKQFQAGTNTSVDITSLFGLSSPVGGSSVNRTLSTAGLGTVVMKPGQYAAVLSALEVVTTSNSMVRSQLVVANNAQATLNDVVQEPVTAINSSTQVSTTSFAGTSDAGTQITISPQISPGDYVTVSYAIGQSSFLGGQVTPGVPPAKSNDNVASTATIPDGYVIALGGLTTHTKEKTDSQVPLLGRIPLLGWLFKSRVGTESTGRFYVFIRASIMRRNDFADLRYASDQRADRAELQDAGEPKLEPQFVK